ncbi:MAG: aspartate kinase [Chitinophagaceae bacterium]|nr:aspartate kinase [Chitinophagaceae bacterium]
MKVFKFGGASVNSAERIRNIPDILSAFENDKILIVVSAMGKTTNALEELVQAFYRQHKEKAALCLKNIRLQHEEAAQFLLKKQLTECLQQLNHFFTETEWLLQENPDKEFDYYYDQIVSYGELYSTTLVSHALLEYGIKNVWLDVRDILRTDDAFREANIDWEVTRKNVMKQVIPLFEDNRIVLTQGFIGCTAQNENTTLGREGSDYTAAVFANLLDAESLTIWKDVPSVMNADPKQFPDAVPLERLSYHEVIEMAYYGAQIIHPKTIKPLQNKGIPLYVKSFIEPELPGTVIGREEVKSLPPVIVLKNNQVLLELRSKDFSFIGEHYIGQLYQLLDKWHLKPNLTQNAAIQFYCVIDDKGEKTEKLALEAADFLDVTLSRNLSLLTVRHYTVNIFERLSKGRTIILKQQTPVTLQALMK